MEETLVLAKERAEESDRLKTFFLQNMSHEIRTPLNAILGFSQLLQGVNTEDSKIHHFSSIINSSGERLLELINNILDISKIEAGSVKINQEAIHLNTLLNHVRNIVKLKAEERNIKIILNMPWDNSKSLIQTDAGKLNQILINLINNAIKFTKNGTVTCSYKLINDDFLEFRITDTGIGIPKEKQKQIFQRFYQVDQSISRGFEGAGLGLSITKALVNLLGGEINFESEYRKGTTFYFTIPYKGRKRLSKKPEIAPKMEFSKEMNVLIAEDDMPSFLFLETLLLDFDMNITRAKNGRQAVELAKNNHFDLILMDINMPIMNGLEATRLIRGFNPGIPIIAQTAFAFAVEEENVLESGCNAYLSKPISKIKLLQIISEYISK
jgi:CheY-like chemotaxis protein/anti-sigma regulatory factor (Ser/Thr protein kinase)